MSHHSKFLFPFIFLFFLAIFSSQSEQILASGPFISSNLPLVIIDTHGQTIPKDDPRIPVDMGIIFNGAGKRNHLTDPPNHYVGQISIKIHGQSSSGWPKKSYRIETENADGSNRDVSLLGMPEENDWILYAPYYDRSLLRNVLVYHLAREMGWYAPRTRYCELFLNGSFRGLYVLTEKIKRDKHRVHISKLKPDEISGDDLTGGYILRIDKEPWNPGFNSPFPAFFHAQHPIRYQYVYPKPDEIAAQQMNYIRNYVLRFERFMRDSLGVQSRGQFSKYLNVTSFLDYFILNELSRNVDGYRLSAYFYKDKDSKGGKLTAGPVWDYNFSFGNVDYYDAWKIEGWQILFFANDSYFHRVDPFYAPFWWKTLAQNALFDSLLQKRWQNWRQTILSRDSLFAVIDSVTHYISEARQRNFEIWPGPGETNLGSGWYPGSPPGMHVHNYDEEIAYLKNWISDRINWMDQAISLLSGIEQHPVVSRPNRFVLKQNYPNPFNSSTVIAYQIAKTAEVRLSVYSLKGQLLRILVNKEQNPGRHTFWLDAHDLASGVYLYTLAIDGKTVATHKMILLH